MATFVILRNGRLQGICRNVGDVEHALTEWAKAKRQEEMFKSRIESTLPPNNKYSVTWLKPRLEFETEKVELAFVPGKIDRTLYKVLLPSKVFDTSCGETHEFTDPYVFLVYTIPDLEAA